MKKLIWEVNYISDALEIQKYILNKLMCLGESVTIRCDEADNNLYYTEYLVSEENELPILDIVADIEEQLGFTAEVED